jgi:biopolymer transport protein TolQ
LAEAANAATSPANGTVLDLIWNAGWVVKGVLLLLLAFSILSWAIILYKWRLFRRAERESGQFLHLFRKSARLDLVYNATANFSDSPLAQIFRAGYLEISSPAAEGRNRTWNAQLSTDLGGAANVERSLHRAISGEEMRLDRALTFLATTGSTTPFIGLFGTVWGIMDSFRSIGITGTANLAVVAPGISEALVATAAGLAAAIPAVVFYNHFLNRSRRMTKEMETLASELLSIAERQQPSADPDRIGTGPIAAKGGRS